MMSSLRLCQLVRQCTDSSYEQWRYSDEEMTPHDYSEGRDSKDGVDLKVPIWSLACCWQEEALTRGGVGKSEVKAVLERMLINDAFKTVFYRIRSNVFYIRRAGVCLYLH